MEFSIMAEFSSFFFFLISVCFLRVWCFQVYCLSVCLLIGHGSQRRHSEAEWIAGFCSAFTSNFAHLMELKRIILLVSYEGKIFSMTWQHDCALIWCITEMFRRGLAKLRRTERVSLTVWSYKFEKRWNLLWENSSAIRKNECSPTAALVHFENVSPSPLVRQNRVLALKIKLSWSECSIIWYAAVCEAALNCNPSYSGPPIIQVCVYVRVYDCLS